jgi:hypothetical protein
MACQGPPPCTLNMTSQDGMSTHNIRDNREIYLVVYHSQLFPAHWALFIPKKIRTETGRTSYAETRKYINVLGDPATGFEHEIKRNQDITEHSSNNTCILIGTVKEKYVSDNGDDEIETLALAISALAKSLKSSAALVSLIICAFVYPFGLYCSLDVEKGQDPQLSELAAQVG